MLLPEGLYRRYDTFVHRYRVILFLITIIILILYMFFLFWKFNKDFQEGSNLSYLRENISKRLLDSCALGLNRYKELNNEYPLTKGKYFFNSIKNLVYIEETYIYYDDLMNYKLSRDSLMLKDSLFVGIGRAEHYLTYKYLNADKYLLYSVGENGLDESGCGDDLVYKK